MTAAVEEEGDKCFRLWSNLLSPTLEPLRRPAGHNLMGWGHVVLLCGMTSRRITADMGGLSLAAVINLDCLFRGPNVDFFTNELVGHAVVMFVILDVVIDMDPGLFPMGVRYRVAWAVAGEPVGPVQQKAHAVIVPDVS